MTDKAPHPRSVSELRALANVRARARGVSAEHGPPTAQPMPPHVSRHIDGPAFDTAAREVFAEADAKKRIIPPNRMTRADQSLCHFLTEGDLARIENANKFGGSSNLAALIYGALLGIAVPFIAAVWKAAVSEGLAALVAPDVASLFIGSLLIGGSFVIWKSSRRHETVQAVCEEYRNRPQQEVE